MNGNAKKSHLSGRRYYSFQIRGLYSDMCLDTMGRDGSNGLLGASHCHGLGGNQLFRLNVAGELVVHKYCIIPMMGQVLIKECGTVGDTTVWEFDEVG